MYIFYRFSLGPRAYTCLDLWKPRKDGDLEAKTHEPWERMNLMAPWKKLALYLDVYRLSILDAEKYVGII